MTVMTRKNLHAQASGFFTTLVGLHAFVTACGPTNSGADALATRPAAATATTATATQNPLSDIDQLANITLAQLDAMQLPMGRWQDDIALVKRVHSARSATYCPNFDIDGNGRIEAIKVGENSYKGDFGMLAKAVASRALGGGWPVDLHLLQGDYPTRLKYWGETVGMAYGDYLNCLIGKYTGGPNRLDIDSTSGINFADAAALSHPFLRNLKIIGLLTSSATMLKMERLNDNMNICYAYFKFTTNGTTTVRVLQQNCGIAPKTTFRRLPDLVAVKTISNSNRATCSYKEGNTTHYSRTIFTNVASKNCGDPANEE